MSYFQRKIRYVFCKIYIKKKRKKKKEIWFVKTKSVFVKGKKNGIWLVKIIYVFVKGKKKDLIGKN